MAALSLVLVVIVGGSFAFYYLLSLRPKPVIVRSHRAPALYVFFVPALNEERVIRNTVDSLLALRGERTLVLVIDDGSDDATATIVESYDDPRVDLLRRVAPHARQGKGAALNFAYRELLARLDGRVSANDVVVGIIDADGRLQQNAIEVMDGLFSGRGVGAVQTMVRILNRNQLLPRFQDYEFVAFGSLTQAAREKLGSVGLGGNGQFTRLSALSSLGPTPWTDCLTEDLDLGIRLAIGGWHNRYTRETWVEQQGLTNIAKLLRQRVRWCHGHFQCWRLIPRLVTSNLPTLTVLDLMYYLLSPALTLVASVVFVVPFALLLARLIAPPMNASWQLYAIYLTLLYLMSFGPALLLSAWYWRRAKDVSAVRAFVIAHGLALYNLVWYVAEWWAIARRRPAAELGEDHSPARPTQRRRSGRVSGCPVTDRRAAVMLVVGTRPEAIKMCPLVHAVRATTNLTPMVVSTGQHTTMLDEVLQLFDVTPDVDLAVHRPGQGLAELTSRCMSGITAALSVRRPDVVVVQGDTATTLAGALSAYYMQIPVVHLEAGLRSDRRNEPFPEEVNRRMVTTLTDLHLAATPNNRDRLLAEGVPAAEIAVTGNTVIDALLEATTWNHPWGNRRLAVLDGDPRPILLVTAHRRENWGEPLHNIAETLAELATHRPDVLIVWPMHANPAVQDAIRPAFTNVRNVVLTDPLNYADFSALLKRAVVVLTDSGGIQEEAPALGKPVLVLRNVTERHEAVDAGAATLIGTDPARIRAEVEQALENPRRPARSPYGDGHASARAAAAIQAMLGVGARLPDFAPMSAHAYRSDTTAAGSEPLTAAS